ncbi:hypothetical protein LMG22037_06299 [Paraburkholderia phenoliruptrix]|uniref:SWI2/SNF2 ATPase domain-containing protein n=1 Tax=Paraburkholderia phenoliruptrix TaxID=252970 RepID=A0A6J5CKA8_9BURK|nr:hypothetical protein LMG22037_06299 [Paraburkholderia phenoliruptrix]
MRAALQQVVTASRLGASHKGGVVWDTQGSGKSITMTCFAARVMQAAAMDLARQLFGVFSLAQDL